MPYTTQQKTVDRIFHPSVMGLLALAIVPLLLLDLSGKLTSTGSMITTTLDWLVIGVFSAEYIARLVTAESKVRYATSVWSLLDLVIILTPFVGLAMSFTVGVRSNMYTVTPILRLLRLGRIFAFTGKSLQELRIHRTLVKNRFYHVAAGTLVLFFAISSVFFYVENGPDHHLTFADALWWGWGALSTIGSEVIPSSGMGRILGTVLMTLGLAFAGFFTANVVSYFQELRNAAEEKREEKDAATPSPENTAVFLQDLLERQRRIDAKLDQLLAQKREDESSGKPQK